MGTAHLNVMIRDNACVPIKTGYLIDLAIQLCSGPPLLEVFPLVDQLKERYPETPAKVSETTVYPISDQDGRTLELTIGSGSTQILNFVGPAITQSEIYTQMVNYFTGCDISIKDGYITITTNLKGPAATITLGGTCDLQWGPITQGSAYVIKTRYYHNATRIMIMPPSGQTINHVELDVPTGCYKIWARVCFGQNEDTSTVMKIIEHCGQCYTVDLLLPEIMHCSRNILYPLMDKVANDYVQIYPELNDRLAVMKIVAHAGNLSKELILQELADRKQDALDIGRTDLADRVDAITELAQNLPLCC